MGLLLCWCCDRSAHRDTRRGICPVGRDLVAMRFPITIRIVVTTPCPCLALEGLSHSEVVFVSWDPHPRERVEGVPWATSVLELAAELADSRAEWKMRFGQRRRVVCRALLSGSCVGRSGVGRQLGQAAVVRAFLWWLYLALLERLEARARLASRGLVSCTAVIAWPCLFYVGIVGLALLAHASGGFRFGVLSVPPSTIWRSEVSVLVVRRPSHVVARWSPRVCVMTLVGGLGIALFCSVALKYPIVGTGNPDWALFARLTPPTSFS
ncbi:hypothetical protein Taro_053824 [Colocasia esculenta]|uniref:Uncharacterized protein n=1 Tax=Colocasia esculenta TaxID=4460 RepID=A0A843XN92_COLES|nr:hypothetical protein [Colocasia esculenta]